MRSPSPSRPSRAIRQSRLPVWLPAATSADRSGPCAVNRTVVVIVNEAGLTGRSAEMITEEGDGARRHRPGVDEHQTRCHPFGFIHGEEPPNAPRSMFRRQRLSRMMTLRIRQACDRGGNQGRGQRTAASLESRAGLRSCCW